LNVRHFLVVAAASRGARFFIKKALLQGHNVTAICRADDDQKALDRIKGLLQGVELTPGNIPAAKNKGKLIAKSANILNLQSYREILDDDLTIDCVCCFVGVKGIANIFSRSLQLYTDTMKAITDGMRLSRWVETFYHGSSGSEGIPGENWGEMPANFKPQWIFALALKIPAFKDYIQSEGILANAAKEGLKFVIFRPASLTNGPARRKYGKSFDRTGMDNKDLPLRRAKITISREDVSEEILRVASLPENERENWHGHGVYLVDLKNSLGS
jgi:hypothetical protein